MQKNTLPKPVLLRSQKITIEKNLHKIIAGDFDITSVRSIFIDLRPYANGDKIFLEFADFVAHPIRDQGIIKNGLEYLFNQGLYYHEYFLSDQIIDLLHSFPVFVKEMIYYLLESIPPISLKKMGHDKRSLKKFITEKFSEQDGFLIFKPEVLEYSLSDQPEWENIKNTVAALTIIVKSFANKPCYTQEEIIHSLIKVLKENNISFSAKDLRRNEDKIIVCILSNLHKSDYILRDGTVVTCLIGGITRRFEDGPNGRLELSPRLTLRSTLDLRKKMFDTELGFRYEALIMQTNLPASLWCDESLFTVWPDDLTFDGQIGSGTFENHDLVINEKFKITPLPYEGTGWINIGG